LKTEPLDQHAIEQQIRKK